MSLKDKHLDQSFVLVGEKQTIAEAMDALEAQGGRDYFHFFIPRAGGAFGVLRVGRLKELLASLGPRLFELNFADLKNWVPEGRVVQQDKVGIGVARKWVGKAPEGVLVVVRGDQVAGRFPKPFRGSGSDPFPGSSMGQLYGDYINTAVDARGQWRPAGVAAPTCPHCGHQDFYDFSADDGTWRCQKCKKIISEKA